MFVIIFTNTFSISNIFIYVAAIYLHTLPMAVFFVFFYTKKIFQVKPILVCGSMKSFRN